MSQYRYRQYQSGDEHAINELYFSVTGRKRSISQYLWQWQNAPGGKGEIWLIEEIQPDGTATLIGHHGLMPIVFSYGELELLAGKTENTMVHPDYRSKILYPKYEKIFLSHYEKKFDLLFSTTGPPAALRQRIALGYKACEQWRHYEWSLGIGGIFSYIAFSVGKKRGLHFNIAEQLSRNIGKGSNKVFPFVYRKKAMLPLQALRAEVAKKHHFFDTFWNKAKCLYGVTPRRNREDLAWRFWDNPYGVHTTLLYIGNDGDSGYTIIRDIGAQNYRLEDIAIYPFDKKLLIKLIHSTCKWVYENGGNLLRFSTTTDTSIDLDSLNEIKMTNLRTMPSFKRRQSTGGAMPRKLTGKSSNVQSDTKWFITPFIYEGRL